MTPELLVPFLRRLAIACAIVIAVAASWSLLTGHPVAHALSMCFMTGACVLLVLAFGAFLVPGIMSWQFAFSNAHEAAELETHDNERSRLEDRGDQLSLGGHKVMLGVTLAALGFLIRYAL